MEGSLTKNILTFQLNVTYFNFYVSNKTKTKNNSKILTVQKKINAFCPSCISTSERVICNHHHHRRNWNWKTHSWLDKWIVNFGIVFTMTPHTFRPGILFIFFFPTPIGKVNQSASVRYFFVFICDSISNIATVLSNTAQCFIALFKQT